MSRRKKGGKGMGLVGVRRRYPQVRKNYSQSLSEITFTDSSTSIMKTDT